jgi:hypothetical protein
VGYSPTLVIPSLVLVEIWHWTPLVMLIVLGGLAALPTEPYESARLDGAPNGSSSAHITLPLSRRFIVVAAVIRTIDALKTFDTIYVITGAGPAPRRRRSTCTFICRRSPSTTSARLGGRRRVLRHRAGARAAAAARAREDEMDMNGRAIPGRRASAAAREALLRKLGFWLSVVVIVSPAIIVFLWMLSLSLKTEIDNIAYPAGLHPDRPTLANFVRCSTRTRSAVLLEQHRRVGGRRSSRSRRRPRGFGIARRARKAHGADPDRRG